MRQVKILQNSGVIQIRIHEVGICFKFLRHNIAKVSRCNMHV